MKKELSIKYNRSYTKFKQDPNSKNAEQEARRLGTSLVSLNMKAFHKIINTYKEQSEIIIKTLKNFAVKQNKYDSQVSFSSNIFLF